MQNDDLKYMREAIEWAGDCHPIKDSIPKVGAIIVKGGNVLGRGRRGTGKEGDNEHAEWNAIHQATDKSQLAGATLYTTLEPCTEAVRTKPDECCTELVRQHQIKKVFIGILDPNQGVTGKGLWRLQDTGAEVALFPHELSGQIRAMNAAFIRSQQTLGATILSPQMGEDLRTYETGGRHAVRFRCLNSPTSDTFLLSLRAGLCWPQTGPFRQVEGSIWEVDAHFGTTGEHTLQLVTANDLGHALIQFYRKVVESNRKRREKLKDKVEPQLLGGDYPGIEINGLPKGLRLEASVTVFISYRVNLVKTFVDQANISLGQTLTIEYEIDSAENVPKGIWLGASFQDATGEWFFNTSQDKEIALLKGLNTYRRALTIPKDAPVGKQLLRTNVWRGPVGDSGSSHRIMGAPPIPIVVRA